MKLTPKFLQGGSFDSLFTTFIPVPEPTAQSAELQSSSSKSSSKSDDDEEKGKLTESQLYSMIKEVDGLPNEMLAITKDLLKTLNLLNLSKSSNKNLGAQFIKTLYKIKLANLNNAEFKKAYDVAIKNGALAEPAISADGLLYVLNEKGEPVKVSLEWYTANKNKGNYKALSVAQLANLRKFLPSQVGNQDAFQAMYNSMGYEAFLKLIKEGIESLGTSSRSFNLMNPLTLRAQLGFLLLGLLSPEDTVTIFSELLLKNTQLSTQALQVGYLLDYLADLFPERAKIWAGYKLGTSDKEGAIKSLIARNLASKASDSKTETYDFSGLYNRNKAIADNNLKLALEAAKLQKALADKTKETFLSAVLTDVGGRTEDRVINLGGQANFHVTGTVYEAVAEPSGKVITDANLSTVLSKSGLAGISNRNSILFGNQFISPTQLSKIAVDNAPGFRAVLPIVKIGTRVAPNFKLIEKFNAMVEAVGAELGNGAAYEQRLALLEKKINADSETRDLINPSTGHLDTTKFMPFFITSGYASDHDINFNGKNQEKYMSETKAPEELNYFKNVTGNADLDVDDNWNDISIMGWSNYSKVYKSDIFIPITTNNRLAAMIFSGLKISSTDARSDEQAYQSWLANQGRTFSTNYLFSNP